MDNTATPVGVDQAVQGPGDGERRASTVNHSVMVGAVGNFVECFDWFAYALFASYISRQVFPAGDPLAGLLSTFAIFAVGFFVRPVGASSSASIPIATDARTRWPRRFS